MSDSIRRSRHFCLQALAPVHQYPYEQEKLLLFQLQNGNLNSTGSILNDLLGYALLPEKSSLINHKSRSTELISVMTRALIENGSDDSRLEQLHNLEQEILLQSLTYVELCEKLQQTACFFLQCLQDSGPLLAGQSAVCRARGYIARHYAGRLTLQETADYVHLNPSYFSSVFKRTYGLSFKEFLNRIRIEKSCQLLAQTNYGILDIAIMAGFEEQSYFTRTFRGITGQTPRQFRLSYCTYPPIRSG